MREDGLAVGPGFEVLDAGCRVDEMVIWAEVEVESLVERGEGQAEGVGMVEDGRVYWKRTLSEDRWRMSTW